MEVQGLNFFGEKQCLKAKKIKSESMWKKTFELFLHNKKNVVFLQPNF